MHSYRQAWQLIRVERSGRPERLDLPKRLFKELDELHGERPAGLGKAVRQELVAPHAVPECARPDVFAQQRAEAAYLVRLGVEPAASRLPADIEIRVVEQLDKLLPALWADRVARDVSRVDLGCAAARRELP